MYLQGKDNKNHIALQLNIKRGFLQNILQNLIKHTIVPMPRITNSTNKNRKQFHHDVNNIL